MKLVKYPKQGAASPVMGVNLIDRVFDVNPYEAQIIKNYLFKGNSLVQRWPFRDYNSDVTTFSAPFRGVHSFKYPSDTAHTLLYGDNLGRVYSFSNPPVLKHTFGTTAKDIDFTTCYDAVVATNGTDVPVVGRASTAWRQFGSPTAVSNLAVSQNAGAGIAQGNYLHIVIPVIEVSGIGQVFANWSNVIKNVVPSTGILSFSGTFTYPADARVTACYVYRTLVNSSVFQFVARVTSGSFTDNFADSALPVASSAAPSEPPTQNKAWGVPLLGESVVFSGNRCVMVTLSNIPNAIQMSQIGATSYECEGFPADGSTIVRMPKDGRVVCAFPIGDTGAGSVRSNNLFVAQEDACYFLKDTDPTNPLTQISANVGVIGPRGIAQWKNWLFFQGRQGVYLWPGNGQEVYLLSEKISPVFNGGGNQNLLGNSGDNNVQYEVFDDTLWITTKSDSALTYPDKCYCLDLNFLYRKFEGKNIEESVRWVGPIETGGTTPVSFGRIQRTLANEFVILDSSNSRILKYSVGTVNSDLVAGASTDMPLRILTGPLLREDTAVHKIIFRVEAMIYSLTPTPLKVNLELGRSSSSLTLNPQESYGLEWSDILWTDIDWSSEDWVSFGIAEFGAMKGRWFTFDITKSVGIPGEAFSGFIIRFFPIDLMGVFK